MPTSIKVHYDNSRGFSDPYLWVWAASSTVVQDFAPTGSDNFGPIFEVDVSHTTHRLKFKDGPGTGGPWEPSGFDRLHRAYLPIGDAGPREIWCTGEKPFVYPLRPRQPETDSAAAFLGTLSFKSGVYVPGTGGFSGLGATPLTDGSYLFGLYHPNAARVFLMGTFNDWQRPTHTTPDPSKFIELKLYRGYFGYPNIWLAAVPGVAVGDEYKFNVVGGVAADEKLRLQQYFTDPYARQLGPDYGYNNSKVIDPSSFTWHASGWSTPPMDEAILYELSVHGFTDGDPDIPAADRGSFRGITKRIEGGFFKQLGVNVLSLMPLAEVPSPQGDHALGYDPSLYFTVERDFGSPDDLRALIDTAHQNGLAVILDQVFNHTSSSVNPLWRMILEHPDEEFRDEGGLYFNGTTDWGNRIATEKQDVQYMLIDACKLLLTEYRADGFRFDATHTKWMDHGFLHRLWRHLKGFKPDVLLVCENLPNESDLNQQGFDGFAQWCDPFHDRIKAVLREGTFENNPDEPGRLPDIFYFSKGLFAAHTNNVVNYCESHDEHSVGHELSYDPRTNHPATKERKSRLALFASLVALGQPMIYMGQEFHIERPRNLVTVHWPQNLDNHGYFQWARRLIRLRRRYPGLRMRGYDPSGDAKFIWILGPWMPSDQGGGKRILGWRALPNGLATDNLVILLNFESHEVLVFVDFGMPGTWVKLADIDFVNDIPPEGTNSVSDPTTLRTETGGFSAFRLPSASAFLYKWESP